MVPCLELELRALSVELTVDLANCWYCIPDVRVEDQETAIVKFDVFVKRILV